GNGIIIPKILKFESALVVSHSISRARSSAMFSARENPTANVNMQNLFVQIFERKRRIVEQVKQQVDLFDHHLASKCLLAGVSPPSWLWPPSMPSETSGSTSFLLNFSPAMSISLFLVLEGFSEILNGVRVPKHHLIF
ncbi:hypothetical protein F2Q69_00001195, partial [Brassica cretica]